MGCVALAEAGTDPKRMFRKVSLTSDVGSGGGGGGGGGGGAAAAAGGETAAAAAVAK